MRRLLNLDLDIYDDILKVATQKGFLSWIEKELSEKHSINNYQGDEDTYYAYLPILFELTVDYFNDHEMEFECYEIPPYYPCYMVKYNDKRYIIGKYDGQIGDFIIAREDNQAPKYHDNFIDLEMIQEYAKNKFNVKEAQYSKKLLKK